MKTILRPTVDHKVTEENVGKNMKEIKICYTDRANIGDAINPYIIRDVLGYEPVLSDAYHCQITGIGSGLRRFFVREGNTVKSKAKRQIRNIRKMLCNTPLILWSAGFLSTPSGNEYAIRKNILVASVRGELSRQYAEKMLSRPVECITGDGGLLFSKWGGAKKENEKKYRLGIIPHVKDKKNPVFTKIHKETEDSIIIDVESEPSQFLSDILSCECIISSSLHGLILSDSYCIPNRHVKASDNLSGDGFKFRDYYSSFGMDDDMQDLTKDSRVITSSILDNYRFTKAIIEKKQDEIISAFNLYL